MQRLLSSKVQLPDYILEELSTLQIKSRNSNYFFGGHPISITRFQCNNIFKELNCHRQSPYLVCEKTDGVRYVLLIALVDPKDASNPSAQTQRGDRSVQCYLISREGQRNLIAYSARMEIGQGLTIQNNATAHRIIQILDGEMVEDRVRGGVETRFLVFDALVHLGNSIVKNRLKDRLDCISKFIQYNAFLLDSQSVKENSKCKDTPIRILMKDFFRLTCPKYNTVQFMFRKYIKCLPHDNDGIIFNHEDKEYVLGRENNGYIKWKPAHLNTLDFVVIPNLNLIDKFGKRILDLYLGARSEDTEGYGFAFYNFTVVSEKEFDQIVQKREHNLSRAFNDSSEEKTEFTGAFIAECKFEQTSTEQGRIFSKLLSSHVKPEELVKDIMNYKYDDCKRQLQTIAALQKNVYLQCWKIYKPREDKSLPNNIETAKKIQVSIRDGISEMELVRKNNQLRELAERRE